MWSILLAVSLWATPFEDIQHRFIIDLPKGWKYAPLPGDTSGATFHRETDGVFANAAVRVMPFSNPISLDTFAHNVAAAVEGEPGYRLLSKEPMSVAGYPGQRRRFITLVNGDPHLPKMVEQRLVVVGQTGFVVHCETLADAFAVFEPDIMQLARSFHPGGGSTDAQPPARKLHARALIGQWQSADGAHKLSLSRGGTIVLDGSHGHWTLQDGLLMASLDGHKHMFEVGLDQNGISLVGGSFKEPISFLRTHVKPHAHHP